MTAPVLDDATIREWSRKSRARQGLPAQITDPTVLAKVITLAFAPTSPLAKENDPAVSHGAVQPPAAAKQLEGRGQYDRSA